MPTSATIERDSVSQNGQRLSTFVLRYPKFIHSELMTHRVFSRNASSSRAVPTAKLLEEVRSDELRAEPSFSVVNASGMQGGRPTTAEERELLRGEWRRAARFSADAAARMFVWGGAKQDVNRLLEPFTHINVVVTSTEWDNFFGLRLDKDAQPEMRKLAEKMWLAWRASSPKLMVAGANWHLPFFQPDDWDALADWAGSQSSTLFERFMSEAGVYTSSFAKDLAVKVSVARCARVSYTSHETGRRSTVAEDLALYDRLLAGRVKHASPAEHQATPDRLLNVSVMMVNEEEAASKASLKLAIELEWEKPRQHGNFHGWRQYRKMLEGEDVAPLPAEYS